MTHVENFIPRCLLFSNPFQFESLVLNMVGSPVCYQASKLNLWTFTIEFDLSYTVLVQKI